MGQKLFKCCCCPQCTTNPGKCCDCICTTICVTLDPPGSGTENACSVELDWDANAKHFQGVLTCAGEDIDLLFYFERVTGTGTDAGCYFVLESQRLNFGGAGTSTTNVGTSTSTDTQTRRWLVGTDILCADLSASVGTDLGLLSFECVEKITPTRCNTCLCLCRCICVTVSTNEYTCAGKACWDEEQQAYVGTLECADIGAGTGGDFTLPVVVSIGPEEGTGTGTGTAGTDVPCYLRVEVDGKYAETLLVNCEERNLNYDLDLYDDPNIGTGTGTASVGSVTIRCAECNEVCDLPDISTPNCPCPELPRRIPFTMSTFSGTPTACDGVSGTLIYVGTDAPRWEAIIGTICLALDCIARPEELTPCENGDSVFTWQVSLCSVIDGECAPPETCTVANPANQDEFGNPSYADPDAQNGYCSCDPLYINVKFLNTACGGAGDGLIRVEIG